MGWWSTVPHPDVTALLTDYLLAEALQCADYKISGHAARQFHAAFLRVANFED
jgi:hypothetical protein